MGFFDFMDKMAKGEPVFQEETDGLPRQQETQTEESGEPTIQKGVESTFPVVQITKVKPSVNGGRLQLYCYIENTWTGPVELDKIYIFDTKRELDTVLDAGQARDFLVYDGPVLREEKGEVKLQYKTKKEGDYFEAEHDAKFSYRGQDGTYEVANIQLNEPIRDIYG